MQKGWEIKGVMPIYAKLGYGLRALSKKKKKKWGHEK